jgi:uncharacterized protein YutE (UPF0331/DUF86 family)
VTRIELVREKIRRIRHVGRLLERSTPEDPEVLARDEDRLHLVAFRVYLGLQETIDLASHVIADEGWGPVASLRDHYEILVREGALGAETGALLSDGVKIRNLIGHAYGEVDPVKLQAAARVLPRLLETFCQDVLAFAEARSEGG